MSPLSENIQIIPLTPNQLDLLLYDISSLEDELKLDHSKEQLSEEQWRALALHYQLLQNSRNDSEWLTLFQIVLKEENIPIGNICLTGGPDEKNVLYVTCFIYDEEKQSKKSEYLLETLKILYRWAYEKAAVNRLVASCGNEMVVYNGEQHGLL